MIVSIDIGTSYSSMCMIRPDGEIKPVDIGTGFSSYGSEYSLPSAVYIEEDGNVLVGQAALNGRLKKPENFFMEFKRRIGQNIPILIGNRSFMPEDFYTIFFRHMKKCVRRISGEQIEKAYLTYPASFGKKKKEKIIEAAKAAGLFDIELVDEPTAAAMSFVGERSFKEGQNVMVYDFGGGTFDVSLLQYKNDCFHRIIVPKGIEQCGGIDMERLIYEDIRTCISDFPIELYLGKSQEKRLRFMLAEKAVKAKHHLSTTAKFDEDIVIGLDTFPYELTREQFEKKIAGMVGQSITVCQEILTEAGLKSQNLSAILMVGGTSRVPLVQKMLTQFADGVPVQCSENLELAVAEGALKFHKQNEIITEDCSEEVRMYFQLARQGDAEAQLQLGKCYFYGNGIDINKEKGIKWYRKAAEQENAEAQYYLGRNYHRGDGIEKSLQEAVNWYRKAAEYGFTKAQTALGVCYELGDGVEKNYREAIRWYKKAAERGDELAQQFLERIYVEKGIKRSDEEDLLALEYYPYSRIRPVIVCSRKHTVALKKDGTVVATGNNDSEQCNVRGWRDIIAIACNRDSGNDYTIGLKGNGTVISTESSGFDEYGVSSWRDIVAVACGSFHTVGLKSDGAVVAVGEKRDRQCNVGSWRNIAAIACGSFFTIGLKRDGTVVGTGDNQNGQCEVSSWRDIKAVFCCDTRTVGLKKDGTVVAAGFEMEQLETISKWKDIVTISCGSCHMVGLKKDGTVVAVGYNEQGECNVGSWRDIVTVSCGGWHTVGVKRDGTVIANGYNDEGQCSVSGWRNIVAVFCGRWYTVGLKKDGTVVAVGENTDGQCNVRSSKTVFRDRLFGAPKPVITQEPWKLF